MATKLSEGLLDFGNQGYITAKPNGYLSLNKNIETDCVFTKGLVYNNGYSIGTDDWIRRDWIGGGDLWNGDDNGISYGGWGADVSYSSDYNEYIYMMITHIWVVRYIHLDQYQYWFL